MSKWDVKKLINWKLEKYYCRLLWKLRREPCLFVNGCDCYGSAYSNTVHTFAVGDSLTFDYGQNLLNIDYTNGDDFLIVKRTGMFFFSYVALFDQPCQLTLFINGVADPSTTVANNSGATQTTGCQLLPLKAGDRVEMKNWRSNSPITTTIAAGGDQAISSTNIDFTLFKISPYFGCGDDGDCPYPPIPFERRLCCYSCENDPEPPLSPCKDKKLEHKFADMDENKDGVLTLEEYKNAEYKKKHHKHH